MTFEDKNIPILLKPTGSISGKIALLRNLYDKAHEKINHFEMNPKSWTGLTSGFCDHLSSVRLARNFRGA